MDWLTSKRTLNVDRTLVMAILNVTPDSFSDGGKFIGLDAALRRTEKYVAEGADILDVGGESTRPGGGKVAADEERRRVIPVIEAVSKRFDIPISVDTWKSEVAAAAAGAGAEIVNDISGFRFDERMPAVAAAHRTGLVLMHLKGTFETMHEKDPGAEILGEVAGGFRWSLEKALEYGIERNRIAFDIGIGFGKTFAQNLELIANLDKIAAEFAGFPLLVGTSRKSFIGKILADAPADRRLAGSLASAAVSAWNGAGILRVHDVRETVEMLKVVEALKEEKKNNEK
ncbi:MAG: dihydropteroate synthase [Acidobacteria bacterium]|nr:dihydropteroate synthase [Acidobacteriota bacterium]